MRVSIFWTGGIHRRCAVLRRQVEEGLRRLTLLLNQLSNWPLNLSKNRTQSRNVDVVKIVAGKEKAIGRWKAYGMVIQDSHWKP